MKKIIFVYVAIMLFGAVSAAAQSEIVPLLEMRLGGLIGGVQNGKYVDAKTTFAKLKGKGNYSIYGTRGRTGEMTTEVKPPTPDEPCEDFYYFESEMKDAGGIAVAADPGWNFAPRTAQTIDLNNATYIKAASDALKTKGIVNARPKIRQAFRVDLEGDGADEVLLTATSYDDNIQASAAKGDYSFVMMRKIVGGKVQNIVVTGDFVTKAIDFGAPGKFEISSIADLNGDGKLEIIVYGAYYEGNWVEVYEVKAGKPSIIKTLNAACGV